MKKLLSLIAVMFFCITAKAQIQTPVKLGYASKKLSDNNAVVFIKADMNDKWHIYGLADNAKDQVGTIITFARSKDYALMGNPAQPAPVKKYEPNLKQNISYFEHSVIFQQKVKLKATAPVVVKGAIAYMVCNDRTCMPREDVNFAIPVGNRKL